jgi:aquaporin TIP
MHDMVHDLARHVAGAENTNTQRDELNCNYHLLLNNNKTPSTYIALPTKVRAMHFRECDKLQLPEQAFSHTLYLSLGFE